MRCTLALLLVLTLASCAGPSPRIAIPAGPVTAPNFGETKPQDWNGRKPGSYPVHGIDRSRWQGSIDWPTARANGVNFAFLKATEGGDIVDPAFGANWDAAARAGVPRGAYHFWYHCRPAAEQARWFIANVPRSPGSLPPVLDMEWTPFSPTCTLRPAADVIRSEATIFLDILEAHYGQRPILYSAPDFFEQNKMWLLERTEFWLRSVAAHPQDVYAGRHWTFWQYTGTGLVPGVRGQADINVFAGSKADWQRWIAVRQQ